MVKKKAKKKARVSEKKIHYFAYPNGDTKEVAKGTLVLDFYSGKVTLPTGVEEFISDNLKSHAINACRSLLIRTNKTINVSYDGKGKYQITSTLFGMNHLSFQRVYLHILETTSIAVFASNSNVNFFF